MDRDVLPELLDSTSTSERLRAARALRLTSTPAQAQALRNRIAREPDHFVRAALERALSKSSQSGASSKDEETEELVDYLVAEEIRSQARQEAVAQLQHELDPLVARLRR